MADYFILNLFLVVIVLYISCPTEVEGYKGLDYPTRGFYNYPGQRLNHPKRMENGVERDEKALNGQILFTTYENVIDYPIYVQNHLHNDGSELTSETLSTKQKRFVNNVQPGYGIKVLYGHVPGTVTWWPSTL